ncbi:DUF3037 domain-containing protein [Clostridium perfringens]|uniref:DUF3037 domain-containing protein n=1 Tax=Clostridium perfringens TaxID=1502 RepID=UPI002A32C018|nr:DUF3037 domain-containing protein [Clostridium perfringens]MDM0725017.1 DUF3037 domain-containing protein [Clostridium perfringens]
MEKMKKKILYSVVRYSPDSIKGEIINVGLIFHNIEDAKVKYFLLDEKANKLKALFVNKAEKNLYKSYKEILEFYLMKSKDDMSGIVGGTYIASYFDSDFMYKLYEYFSGKEMVLSQPNIAFTKNETKFFETILNRYIGESNVDFKKNTSLTAKKYLKKIFNESEILRKKVKSDVSVKPIKELDDLEIKIDFTFKNNNWNYMQTIPNVENKNKNTEWFSKMQLLLDAEFESTKIHLIYKKSDIYEDKATFHLLKYLKNRYNNLEIHNIDSKSSVDRLCNYIEKEGEILEEVI